MVCKAAKAGFVPPREMLEALGIVVSDSGAGVPPASPEAGTMPAPRDTGISAIITVPELRAAVAAKLARLDLKAIMEEAFDRMRGRV